MLHRTLTLASLMAALSLIVGCSAPIDSDLAKTNSQASQAPIELERSSQVQNLMPEELTDKGQINIVGTQGSPPTSFSNPAIGSDGLNADLARAIASIMGLQANITLIPTDGIVPGLQSNKYDLAVASMSPSSERLEVLDMVAFTKGGSAIGVPEGNPRDLTPQKLCGLRVGVPQASFQSTHRLPELNEEECSSKNRPSIRAVTLPDQGQTLLSLTTNRVEAIMVDGPVLSYALKKQGENLDVLKEDSNPMSTGGLSVKKGSTLTPALVKAMEVLRDSPEYEQIYKKWGMPEYALPHDELGELEE